MTKNQNLVTITATGPTQKAALENLANQLPAGAPEDLDVKIARAGDAYAAVVKYDVAEDPVVRKGTGATPSLMGQYRDQL